MVQSPNIFALRGRVVLPVSGPPLPGGYVTIDGERIVGVGSAPPDCPVHDLGDVAIVPGFVNAHTHLEFNGLDTPLGRPGMPLPQWIRTVIRQRRAANGLPTSDVVRGIRECLQSGTTTLGEIATFDWPSEVAARDEPLPETVVFHEVIAPTEDRFVGAAARAEAVLNSSPLSPSIHVGLSPHAPYTVHRRMFETLVTAAGRCRAPLAMHLAESPEEIELLRTGGGPMREMLVELGAWDGAADARYDSALGYLEVLARGPRALVIHGNYLDDAELDFVAGHAGTMSIVYCPRTHAYFGHTPYRLGDMLARGIHVALGTDSRASNPDLDMLAEMRFVTERHAQVSPAKALRLATEAGAVALGLQHDVGTLEPGKLANLAIIAADGELPPDSHDWLLESRAKVAATYLRGRRVVATTR
ncbi:MAG: amidohydrolase family protein [Pirellulales bacterium]